MTNKKGKGKSKGRSRFPSGMTNKRAGNGKGRSRFPSGMTNKEATARANAGVSPLRRKQRASGRDDKIWWRVDEGEQATAEADSLRE
jgi:hypothetical protein